MFTVARRFFLAGAMAVTGLGASPTTAQQPPAGVDVLARGPVHEAFATTAEPPAPTPVINRRPPEPVEELPPDERPEGDNVLWVPGYWHYDEERTDFIWISGFWRAAPPGRVWVPGSWREAGGGHQWVQGFWQDVTPTTPNAGPAEPPAIEYLPPPPAPLELTPSIPAPDSSSFYVPGSWVYRHRYVWRPGFWIAHRPNWIWTPAYYRWSPAGYVFVDGYWDYPLASRGTLFAPVYFRPGIVRPSFVYTPYIVVNEPSLHTSLFVRRGWGNYYFGDYFEPRYSQIGFNAWYGTPRGSGFAVGVTIGNNRPYYDPLWNYYRIQNAGNPQWANNINNVYVGRYNGSVPRPPRTLVQQTTIVNNVTNNNTTIVNNVNNSNNQIMLTSLKEVNKTNTSIVLKPVANDQRVAEQKAARELRDTGAQRQRLESRIAQQGGIPSAPAAGNANAAPAAIQSIKLDTSRQAVARAQMPKDEKKAPPPPAARLRIDTNATGPAGTPGTGVSPTIPGRGRGDRNPNPNATTPNPVPGGNPVAPKVDPKLDPKVGTPLTPAPRPGLPKVDPKPAPPVGNPGTPNGEPRKGMVNPALPKVDPKPLTPAPALGVKPPAPAPVPTPAPANNPPTPTPNPGPIPAPRRGSERKIDPPKVVDVKPATPAPAPIMNKPPTPTPQPQPVPRQITPPPTVPTPVPANKPPMQDPRPQPAPRQFTPPPLPVPTSTPQPQPQPGPRQYTPPPMGPQPAPRQIAPPPQAPAPQPAPVINPAPKPAPPASGNGNGGSRGSGNGGNSGSRGNGRRGGSGM